MTRYVVGFASEGQERICLIRKARPAWQAGKLNGVGGHVEEGETYEQAMIREFREETGGSVVRWMHFATLTDLGAAWEVAFFCGDVEIHPETITDEKVEWVNGYQLPKDVISNLRYLIPMAFYCSHDWPFRIIERSEPKP